MANALVLDTTSIREQDGLYSLNDLHKASGSELRHRPCEFLRIEQTQELISELGKGGNSHLLFDSIEKDSDVSLFIQVIKGRNGGTYACRELVIAYAAWISAAFHLKVIRVFLAQTQQPSVPTPAFPMYGQRLLVTFLPNGQMESQTLKADECVVSPNSLSSMLTLISDYVPTQILLEIVRRSFDRLSSSVQHHR